MVRIRDLLGTLGFPIKEAQNGDARSIVMPTPMKENRMRISLTSALSYMLACGTLVGCDSTRDPSAPPASVSSTRWTSFGFGNFVVNRANEQCRCVGDELKADCVADAAAQVLDLVLDDVVVSGEAPSIDTAQIASLEQYLETSNSSPGACDLRQWMNLVSQKASGSRSSGRVLDIPELYRVDGRHPNSWQKFGFMAASKNPKLTENADPYDHFKTYSEGSQVWVSVSTTERGMNNVSEESTEETFGDVCIMWHGGIKSFYVEEDVKDCDHLIGGGRPFDMLGFPLDIRYQYRTTSSSSATPAFQPDTPEVEEEDEALLLGFRPTQYRGWVGGISDHTSTTAWKNIKYAKNEGCVQQERPENADISPFDGVPVPP
ncbi:MAG: hypothetical protein AAF799_10235 [Myxococcota bacterium]